MTIPKYMVMRGLSLAVLLVSVIGSLFSYSQYLAASEKNRFLEANGQLLAQSDQRLEAVLNSLGGVAADIAFQNIILWFVLDILAIWFFLHVNRWPKRA